MTSDVYRQFLTYLTTVFDGFYPVTSDIWGGGWNPLTTQKSDVIHGDSLILKGIKDKNCVA